MTYGLRVIVNDIAINLLTALRLQVRRNGCRINIADATVNVTPTKYHYPDLVVSCDERDKWVTDAIRCPKLIVEVLAEEPEARDRGEKLKEFRGLASLEEYVLMSSTDMEVENYRRGEGRMWLYTSYQRGELIRRESVDVEGAIALLDEGVNRL